MHLTPAELLRGLLKVVVVVVAAGGLGVGLGIGLSKLTGNDGGAGPETPAAVISAGARTSTGAGTDTGAVTDAGTSGATKPAAVTGSATGSTTLSTLTSPSTPAGSLNFDNGISLTVRSVKFVPADMKEGTARKRGRLSVRVIATNSGTEAVITPLSRINIRESDVVVRPDQRAEAAVGALLRPVAAGETAEGELRFETEGELTTALSKAREVKLRFGRQAILVKLE